MVLYDGAVSVIHRSLLALLAKAGVGADKHAAVVLSHQSPLCLLLILDLLHAHNLLQQGNVERVMSCKDTSSRVLPLQRLHEGHQLTQSALDSVLNLSSS